MTTFAEEVHNEIFNAPEGATRFLFGRVWKKCYVSWSDEPRWISDTLPGQAAKTDIQMYEATIDT